MARTSPLRRAPGWDRATPRLVRGDPGGRAAVLAQLGSALLLSAVGGAVIASTGEWQVAAGLLAGAAFVALGLLQPALFLGALLVVRPLLDGVSGNAADVVGVVLIGVCAVAVTSRPEIVHPRASLAFAALLLVSAMASLPSLLEFRAVLGVEPVGELVRLVALFAVFFLAAQVVTTVHAVRTLFLAVGLSGVLPAVSALVELAGNPEEIANLGLVRVSGTFVNPVALGSFLGLCVFVLLSLPKDDVPRWVRWPAVGVMGAALVASYGREGWALLLIAIVVLHWRERTRVIAGVAVVCTALVVLVPGVQARVLPSESDTGSPSGSTFASYDWRLSNWRGLLQRYGERPLTGWGLESTTVVNPRRPAGADPGGAGGFQAHNAAVRALVEGGVLLLAAVFAWIVAMIAALRRVARTRGSPLRPYARLATAAWIGMLVVALSTNDLLDATALMYAALAMTGAVEGVQRRRELNLAAAGTGRARTR